MKLNHEYFSVSFNGEIFAFRNIPVSLNSSEHRILKVSVLNPQKFQWQLHELKVPNNFSIIRSIATHCGLIYHISFIPREAE